MPTEAGEDFLRLCDFMVEVDGHNLVPVIPQKRPQLFDDSADAAATFEGVARTQKATLVVAGVNVKVSNS